MAKSRRSTQSTGLHATRWTQRMTLGLASLAMVGMTVGFVSSLVGSAPAAPTSTVPAPTGALADQSPATTTTTTGPFVAGQLMNFHQPVLTLGGHPTTLARGSRGTVVLLMASWCLYCGYEDRWVMPILAQHPGVAVDIVDVSPNGGIANPGPETPAFTGHDGTRQPITVHGMEQTMQQYSRVYHLTRHTDIHVYVAPVATQKTWAVPTFPTMAFVSARGHIAVAPSGAQTLAQAQQDWTQAVHG